MFTLHVIFTITWSYFLQLVYKMMQYIKNKGEKLRFTVLLTNGSDGGLLSLWLRLILVCLCVQQSLDQEKIETHNPFDLSYMKVLPPGALYIICSKHLLHLAELKWLQMQYKVDACVLSDYTESIFFCPVSFNTILCRER